MSSWLYDTDLILFRAINGAHQPFLDAIMWHLSGKLEWIPVYLILLYVAFKKMTLKQWGVFIASILLCIAISDMVGTYIFKINFNRERPSWALNNVHLLNDYRGAQFQSFISNHAANFFAWCTFVYLAFKAINMRYAYLIFVCAILVSYSRVYLGVHYPGDVIFGALVGVVIGRFVYFLYNSILKKLVISRN